MADRDDPQRLADAWRRLAELAVRLTVADPPPSSSPRAALLRFARHRRFTAAEMDRVRTLVEMDADFRQRLVSALNPDNIDGAIIRWLADPSTVAPSPRQQRVSETDRVRVEIERLTKERDQLRRTVAQRDESLRQLQDRLDRGESRLADVEEKVRKAQAERDAVRGELTRQQAAWEQARSHLTSRVAELTTVSDDLMRQRVDLEERLADLASDLAGQQRERRMSRPPTPEARQPLAIPGGLLADSVEAARFLLDRTDVVVIVDGYNAVLEPWTEGPLSQRRHVLLSALDAFIAHRGPRVLVVFDGAADVGGSGDRRLSRVVFSAPDVIADDVVCLEIERLPTTTPVVVVTDDQGLVRRVRRQGANAVSVAHLWGVLRR